MNRFERQAIKLKEDLKNTSRDDYIKKILISKELIEWISDSHMRMEYPLHNQLMEIVSVKLPEGYIIEFAGKHELVQKELNDFRKSINDKVSDLEYTKFAETKYEQQRQINDILERIRYTEGRLETTQFWTGFAMIVLMLALATKILGVW